MFYEIGCFGNSLQLQSYHGGTSKYLTGASDLTGLGFRVRVRWGLVWSGGVRCAGEVFRRTPAKVLKQVLAHFDLKELEKRALVVLKWWYCCNLLVLICVLHSIKRPWDALHSCVSRDREVQEMFMMQRVSGIKQQNECGSFLRDAGDLAGQQ